MAKFQINPSSAIWSPVFLTNSSCATKINFELFLLKDLLKLWTQYPGSVVPLAMFKLKTNPRDLWPLRHLISVMRRHDLTKKVLPTYIPTHPPTYLPTWSLTEPLLNFLLPVAGFFLATGAAMCAHNWDTRQSCRLVTFETLIAILTIENLNSWQSLLPDN